jgi:serine/threonine protein kinase/class 3 adenylate cyclase/uncharacterized membrane protein HdeD (DUF308 family)
VSSPPTGTLTFLFTDMEGSTSHWQRYRPYMPVVLRRHFEILRSCVESHEGYVFKTVGDACCAAFSDPTEGLRAAIAVQRALLAERWSGNVPVRVRVALHHGHAAEERGGDYFGPPVNLVARLLSVARGGQIVLSGVVADLVGDDLPHFVPGAQLRDLGERRLKDITRPVRVFQLFAPELPRVEGLEPPDEDEERYRIEQLVGEGGMARVYLAYDPELDSQVALKVLREDLAENPEVVERFRREARSAASLRGHPNIVTLYDRGKTRDGSYYLAMEYVPGGALNDLIKREGLLPADKALGLTLQVAQALRLAHQRGIVHRDVKPQNVLLTEEGEAKVADFGIAKAMDTTAITRTGSVLGTPQYLSPEQALGQPATPKSDLYSLGVALYEMLTGELPHNAETPAAVLVKHIRGELRPPREINPDVPEQLNDVAVRLLAREPEDRYPDAGALVEDLERISKGLVNGDRREERPKRVRVPDLAGRSIAQASGALEAAGLRLGARNETHSDTEPEGEVVAQEPALGNEVEAGSLVSVTVSSGPHEVRRPVPPGDQTREVTYRRVRAQSLLPSLTGSWWAMSLRGLVIAIFGLLLLLMALPDTFPGTLRLHLALLVTADGLVARIDANTRADRRGPLIIQSRFSFLIGFLVGLVWLIRDVLPNLVPDPRGWLETTGSIIADLAVAPRLVGIWAIIIACIRIIAAIQLRWETTNLWLMAISGASLAVFGILFLPLREHYPQGQYPGILLGFLALVSGIALIAVALRVRDR